MLTIDRFIMDHKGLISMKFLILNQFSKNLFIWTSSMGNKACGCYRKAGPEPETLMYDEQEAPRKV